uniref:Uncharacterized protein n=1 Tax=Anguilla anguilla TaxID=7936 RepID=A0A0E9VD13_ANGAN
MNSLKYKTARSKGLQNKHYNTIIFFGCTIML